MRSLLRGVGTRAFYTNLVRDSKFFSPWMSSLGTLVPPAAPAMRTRVLDDELLSRFYSGSYEKIGRKQPVKLGRVNELRVVEGKSSAGWARLQPSQPRFTPLG